MRRFTFITLAIGLVSYAQAQWWLQPITGIPTFGSNGTLTLPTYPALLVLEDIDPNTVKPEAKGRLQTLVDAKSVTCVQKLEVGILVVVGCTFGQQNLSQWLVSQNLGARGSLGNFQPPKVVYFTPSFVNVGKSVTTSNSADFYLTCDDAREAGVAPLKRGQSGYRSELDADGDGIACE